MIIFPVTKTYEGRCVLDFPGMELEQGKIYCIIGANGSGKSTLAKIVSGALKADKSGRRSDAQTVGYMPQKNYAFRMSTRKNLLLNAADEKRADELLEALQMTELRDKPAHRLSGGETARMALARLMMKNYELVILDEPTAPMDMESTILAERLINKYVKETGCTLLMVTHSLQQAQRLGDYVLYFHKGQLLEQGSADRLLYNPEKAETRQFLEFYGA